MSGKYKNHNFKNSQNYIKNKSFDKYFYIRIILHYFIKNTLISSIIFLVISIIFISIFNSDLFIYSGLVFQDLWNYYYFNKKFFIFYALIVIWYFVLLFFRKNNLKEISIWDKKNIWKLKNNYIILNNIKWNLFIIFALFCIIIFLLFWLDLIFASKIFLIWFFILLFSFVFDFLVISKEKVFIKRPFSWYCNISNSIAKNNLILNYDIKETNNKKKKYYYLINIISFIFLFSFLFILFFSVSKSWFDKNFSYFFMSTNLDNLVKKDLLNLENKNLWYESKNNIFSYLDKKNIKKLNISENNYNDFIYWRNKIDFINYWNVENYYKYEKLEKIILDYKKIKKYYKEISFSENEIKNNSNKKNWIYIIDNTLKEINISEFYDKYNVFKNYYEIDKNKIKKIDINFKTNSNILDKIDINLKKLNKINKDLEKSKENFLMLLNDKDIFEKWFNIKIKNAFLDDKYLKEKIDFFTKIDNKNINLSFEWKYSEYLNKYFEFKNIDRSKAGTTVLKFSYKNKYILSKIIENLLFKYKNLYTLDLNNIRSNKEIVVDFNKINPKSLKLGKTDFKLVRENNNKDWNSILVNWYKKSWYSKDKNYIYYPDFIVNKDLNKIIFWTEKNNLFEKNEITYFPKKIKYWHYKFSDEFLNWLYQQNSNTHMFLNHIYAKYFDYIFKNKIITDNVLEDLWHRYQSEKFFKRKVDFFIKINNLKVDWYYEGLTYWLTDKLDKIENKKEKIKYFFNYLLKSDKIKKFLEEYNIFTTYNIKYFYWFKNSNTDKYDINKINFQEIFKVWNTIIFVKNNEKKIIKKNNIFCINTSHPSWSISSSWNKIVLNKYTKDWEDYKWKTIKEIWTFVSNPDLYKVYYSSDNKPKNWYSRESHYSNTKYNWMQQRCMFVSDSIEEMISKIKNSIELWENWKYAANFSGWDLNKDNNFWTVFSPKKWLVDYLSNLDISK